MKHSAFASLLHHAAIIGSPVLAALTFATSSAAESTCSTTEACPLTEAASAPAPGDCSLSGACTDVFYGATSEVPAMPT